MPGREKRERRYTQIMEQPQSDAEGATRDWSGFADTDLTRRIIGCFFRVHSALGFGFLESVYVRALGVALRREKIEFELEAPIDVYFEGERVGHFRVDVLVERRVLVEVKASTKLAEADHKQLLNYLKGCPVEVGLLLHFGPTAKVHRLVHSNQR